MVAPITPKGIVTFFDEDTKIPLTLIQKTQVSPDSFVFRFQLPSSEHVPGLLPHYHVRLHAVVDGEKISRKMTPITDDDIKGYMDLLIKIYYKTLEYPDGGKFTQWMDQVKVGDEVTMTGPVFKLYYEGNGKFGGKKVKHLKGRTFKNIVLIAGGSGITPMWQIITHSLKYDNGDINVYLLFANRTPKDVLLREELDKLAKEHPRFKVWYTVNRDFEGDWKYSTGYINKKMLQDFLPPASEDTITLIIGPRPMKTEACFPNLDALGYHQDLVL